jgi:uncharacterized membrane protein
MKMSIDALESASVFFSGLLAGLDPRAHIEMHQDLIRTLKVLAPIIFAASLSAGIVSTTLHWDTAGRSLRLASVILLLAFFVLTLLGTVPINQAVGRWDPP